MKIYFCTQVYNNFDFSLRRLQENRLLISRESFLVRQQKHAGFLEEPKKRTGGAAHSEDADFLPISTFFFILGERSEQKILFIFASPPLSRSLGIYSPSFFGVLLRERLRVKAMKRGERHLVVDVPSPSSSLLPSGHIPLFSADFSCALLARILGLTLPRPFHVIMTCLCYYRSCLFL